MNQPLGQRQKAPMDYVDLHWGTKPQRETDMKVLSNCRVIPVAEIAAISYATVKDGEPHVYRHPFEKHKCEHEGRERGPYLLKHDEKGDLQLGECPDKALSIGWLVDIETESGERVFCANCHVVTDTWGRHVWITSPAEAGHQIEARNFGHFVTVHGIEE